jgi:NNP family nitrate/nitrite transporter-like MFS transporter
MANIDAFYPQRLKGWALGLNAGGGNIGVAGVQLVGLAVLATAGAAHPRLVLAVYIPLIVVATAGAALFMDNLTHATNEKRAMRDVMRDRHAWIISFLYVGTFGSFIGFGFAFGQVLQGQFGDTFHTPMRVAGLTFLGPLLGSLFRPVGGRLADRYGGARVTAIVFTAMAAGGTLVLVASLVDSLPLFVIAFISLFVLTGLGNGSVYKMIPAIFKAQAAIAVATGADTDAADRQARRSSRALIGIAGAVGAMGGVGVNLALRQSFLSNGTGDAAYAVFIGFFVVCLAVTWSVYLRPSPRRLAGV